MKRDLMTMLLGQLKAAGHYLNDGQGHLFRYDQERGCWMALNSLTGKRYLSLDTRKEKHELLVGELDILFRELRENVNFSEPGLSEGESTPLVAVANGVVDLRTGELLEHNPQLYLRYSLDFTYRKEVTTLPDSNAWRSFAQSSMGIEDVNADGTGKWKAFLEACMYALSGLPNAKKLIVLIGPPHSGKSVILKFLESVIGETSWMPMTFADLNQRFRGSLLEGQQLLVCDEMPVKPIKNLDTIKKVISGDPILIENKCVDPKKYRPMAKMVFAANNMPVLGEVDNGGGFADRLMLIPFVERTNDTDPYLRDKLWADRDDFLSLAVKMMPELIERGLQFSRVFEGERILREFKAEGFSLQTFIKERCVPTEGSWLCLSEFYEQYLVFCKDNMVRSIARNALKPSLAQLGYNCQRKRIPTYPNAVICVQGLKYQQGNGEASHSDELAQAKTKVVVMRKED